jgi:hypothetical protein
MASIISGRKVVAAGGTAESLSATSVAINRITITAETDNTNPVTVGGSDVVGALATRKGVPLAAGVSITFDAQVDGVDELSDIYLDVVTSGEGVTYLYTPAS